MRSPTPDRSCFGALHRFAAWWAILWRWTMLAVGIFVAQLPGTAAAASASELVNISVRTRVGTGDSVLIAGFVVSGAGTRPLLVRAVGPTLGAAPYHVPGVLLDPGVRLHRDNTMLQVNDDWANDASLAAAFGRLGAFALLPDGKDAALLAPLTEGIYTAVAFGQSGESGEMLLEVYDAREGAGPVPAINNLSLRAELPAGGTMIAGFVVAGAAPKRLLIRAIGPTLETFGVTGVLADPRLRLFTGQTDVAVNDNWNEATNAEALTDAMRALGAFALSRDARDAAALTTLQPGSYTLHVTSTDPAAGGVTLVEIYDAEPVLAATVVPPENDPVLPTVTVTASDGAASEAGDNASLQFTRDGATSDALVVQLHWSGTAMAGLDFAALPASVTIPAGSATVSLSLTPLSDALVEAPEAAIVALRPDVAYNRGAASEAGILIADAPAGTTAGWRAEYFNNVNLAGPPALERTDAAITFEWLQASPGPGVNIDQFSARWTGVITPPATQDYTFIVRADDRVRLWIGEQLVIDRPYYDWRETAATLRLAGGVPHLIRLEMVEEWWEAGATLEWSTTGQPRHSLTEVIAPGPTPAAAVGLDRTVALVGESFVAFIDATGNPTTYSAAGLPAGLALNPASGVISGTPDLAGEFPLWLGASNANGGGSVEVTLRVLAPAGTATREIFAGAAGPTIPFNVAPSSVENVTGLELTTASGPLLERVRGYLTAPSSGVHRFWLSASGTAEFHFADSAEPADKLRRAQVTDGTGLREWSREAGQMSPPLELTAGERYYFEIIHSVDTTSGQVELGWLQPGQTGVLPFGLVPGLVLSPFLAHVAAADGTETFLATLRPATTSTSLASGEATLTLAADAATADVALALVGLSSPITAVHILAGAAAPEADVVVGTLPNGSFENHPWTITATGDWTAAELATALRAGGMVLRVSTLDHPAGEIEGAVRPALSAMDFHPPAEPPALTLDAPTAIDAARFLTQATFGPTVEEIARLQDIGFAAWLNEQFAAPRSLMLPYIQQIRTARQLEDPEAGVWTDVMTESWWRNVIEGEDQLRQRVAFALSELFVISEDSALEGQLDGLATYYDMLAAQAFGNFRDLLEDVTLSPAMGVYLSMIRNRKPDPAQGIYPDENYAREVLQLFSIGLYRLHPDGTLLRDSRGRRIPTYQQENIVGLAHVFTGWTYESDDPEYYYLWGEPNFYAPMEYWPEHHDRGAKRLLEGEIAPADREGPVELAHVMDRLFEHPNTGPFICRQLIQRLVTSNPSPGYVYRVARVFADNGAGTRGDLGAVVRAILLDWEARSATAAAQPGYGKLREPLVRIAQLWRAFHAQASGGLYNFAWTADWLGQEVLQSPTVFNFFQPSYVTPGPAAAAGLVAPEFQVATDGNMAQLINTLDWFAYRPADWTVDPVLDVTPVIARLGDPAALADYLDRLLCAGGMTEGTRARLLTMLADLPAWFTPRERAVAAVFFCITAPDYSIQK